MSQLNQRSKLKPGLTNPPDVLSETFDFKSPANESCRIVSGVVSIPLCAQCLVPKWAYSSAVRAGDS